ncbi:MAG TPA: hypothetical protein VKQ34_02450 [Candidatus Saccharimonadales bacterium]|nr:hypothetical protein [Candidatus Saccharimonadales bacterium]
MAMSALPLFLCPPLYAQQSSSSHYQVNEVFFGAGGDLNDCSASYCAKESAGEVAAGNTAGTAFQAQAGFNTNRDPYLAFSVAGGSTDLGTLSTAGTAITTATFAVKTYLASGYVVQLASDPPTNNGSNAHTLTGLTSPTAASVGSEQFGVNLVQNKINCTDGIHHAPANFGNDAVQVPDNTFSFGTVASGYNTCGLFKYVKNDVIASSTKSSGETDYTISFIYDISTTTPDGLYTYNGTLVATSTF